MQKYSDKGASSYGKINRLNNKRVELEIKELHMPRCHWNKQRGKHIHAKRAFDSLEDANEYMYKRNLIKQGYGAYRCRICGMYHIGHNNNNTKQYER